eukprot:3501756-Alexandrium_andersonii.AAC.1
MSASLVGSEMCIRDSSWARRTSGRCHARASSATSPSTSSGHAPQHCRAARCQCPTTPGGCGGCAGRAA